MQLTYAIALAHGRGKYLWKSFTNHRRLKLSNLSYWWSLHFALPLQPILDIHHIFEHS